ncbi:hypothetical protein [Mycolicibacterium pallens]|uniref:Secreted protein n=1 Tax=Mycolicibacterium pallens TaxID=370524 RepID=A0ABX8VNF0_9MYCO|nr:hypothetical protein [Mycolicibacterium pallens]QYL19337.1 hypothetical protein K0O64_13135 [Mycolicibacterium pallens]
MTAAVVALAIFGVVVIGVVVTATVGVAGLAVSVKGGFTVSSVAVAVAVVPSLGDVVDSAASDELATVTDGVDVVTPAPEVVVALEPDPLAAGEVRGALVDCLLAGCFRADPAVELPRVGFEDVPESLVEVAFGAESDEPASAEADATPCPAATVRPTPTAAAKIPLRAACLPMCTEGFRWRAAFFRWRPPRFLELTNSPAHPNCDETHGAAARETHAT